ncbi:MAG TPA: erythromycin esterase family protein [Firmicutes bacterium]|nr:erythromycin esterase family protein [Candidatus Fermentithermobacillaceae bacterium]
MSSESRECGQVAGGKPGCDEPSCEELVTAWLKSNAHPIKYVEAGNGFDDLEPFGCLIDEDSVRVVGLGEATHGTREFFQLKHRLLEYLVSKKGFHTFILEAGYDVCQGINDYVLYGQGDAASALAAQGFWTWDTIEVLELIQWMRRYNMSQPRGRKVRFYGCDCQSIEKVPGVILGYLERVAPYKYDEASIILGELANLRILPQTLGKSEDGVDIQARADILNKLYGLLGYISHNRMPFVRRSSPEEYESALQHLRVCIQYASTLLLIQDPVELHNSRDSAMAENVEYIINVLEPGGKAVVWAHNMHVTTFPAIEGLVTMGQHLRRMFGRGYYALGLTFNQGWFQALDGREPELRIGEFSLPPAREGSVEWYFAKAGLGDSYVDFRRNKDEVVQHWLDEPRAHRQVGGGFNPDWPFERCESKRPMNQYDGIVYIGRTSRARPTATGWRSRFGSGSKAQSGGS